MPRPPPKPTTIAAYNAAQLPTYAAICDHLAAALSHSLPQATSKIWHGGPVWFIDDNPVVGYWVRKPGVQLLFWSGQSFDEPQLKSEGKFKAAQIYFTTPAQINDVELQRWLAKAGQIQWDYKNIVKRQGVLEKSETGNLAAVPTIPPNHPQNLTPC